MNTSNFINSNSLAEAYALGVGTAIGGLLTLFVVYTFLGWGATIVLLVLLQVTLLVVKRVK